MGQLQHGAQWAENFGGSDTNIAQRSQHNQEIVDYANALQDQRAAQQSQLLQTNKTAQDLFIRTQQLQQQQQLHAATLGIQQAKVAAQFATEQRKAAEEMAMHTDTAGFNQYVSQMIVKGVKPQSADWKYGIADALAQYSHANPQDVARYGASLFPGEQLSPGEIVSRAQSIVEKNPNLQVSVNPKGETSVLAKPSELTPTQHRTAIENQMKDDRLRDSEIEKQLGDLTADEPWLKTTTGAFTHTDGKQYFGNSLPTDSAATLPIVTPSRQKAYERFQSLLGERSIIASRHQNLQTQMSQLYAPTDSGKAAPVNPTPAVVAPAATPPTTRPTLDQLSPYKKGG